MTNGMLYGAGTATRASSTASRSCRRRMSFSCSGRASHSMRRGFDPDVWYFVQKIYSGLQIPVELQDRILW